MAWLMCLGGKRCGIVLLGPNVIFSYGWLLRGNTLLGRIFTREVSNGPLFAFYVFTVRKIPPIFFLCPLSREI